MQRLIPGILTGLACLLCVDICLGAKTPSAADLQRALDRQPAVDEKPFAPADGAQCTLNPPALVWLPVAKRPSDYRLALSQSRDFPAAETKRIDAVPISVYVPHEPLPPGTWYWRVGLCLPDKKIVWGHTRSFTIAASARRWPLPRVETLVDKIPHSHPRLFFPGEKLAQARQRAKTVMASEYRSLVRAAERYVGQPLIAEPPRLTKKGPEGGRIYAQIIRETRPPMDAMETCALAYLLGGDRRFGEEAKRRLLYFFAWDPEGSTNLFHNDEPAMWVMQRGTRAYDWTYDLFTPEERAKIEPVMQNRARQFLRRLTRMPFESRPYSSHPARDLGFLGESAITFIHEWPEARQWLHYILSIYWSVYPAWGQEDGGWQEGPGYWGAYMSFALNFATALREATGVNMLEKPFFRNTPYYKLYCNPPYARLSPFGDSQENPARSGDLVYHFASLLQDPYLRWYPEAQRTSPGGGAMGFALYDPKLTAKPPRDLPQARCFPGAGLVGMHHNLAEPSQNAYLVLRSSPFGSVSHGHADQNAFAIEAFGEALAIASGYYPWYGSLHHDLWTRETKAVNSVTIDGGQGQKKRVPQASGRIVRFLTTADYHYAQGDATPAYFGKLTKFVRHVVQVRPYTFVVVDQLEAPQPVVFEWWLHALEKMTLGTDQVDIRRAKARLHVTFVEPRSLALRQTDQFDPPPEKPVPAQWHLTASTPEKTRSAVFLVVLEALQGDTPPAQVRTLRGADLVGASWKNGSKTAELRFQPSDARLTLVQGNAPVAVLNP
jgi:hypothetical protein